MIILLFMNLGIGFTYRRMSYVYESQAHGPFKKSRFLTDSFIGACSSMCGKGVPKTSAIRVCGFLIKLGCFCIVLKVSYSLAMSSTSVL